MKSTKTNWQILYIFKITLCKFSSFLRNSNLKQKCVCIFFKKNIAICNFKLKHSFTIAFVWDINVTISKEDQFFDWKCRTIEFIRKTNSIII